MPWQCHGSSTPGVSVMAVPWQCHGNVHHGRSFFIVRHRRTAASVILAVCKQRFFWTKLTVLTTQRTSRSSYNENNHGLILPKIACWKCFSRCCVRCCLVRHCHPLKPDILDELSRDGARISILCSAIALNRASLEFRVSQSEQRRGAGQPFIIQSATDQNICIRLGTRYCTRYLHMPRTVSFETTLVCRFDVLKRMYVSYPCYIFVVTTVYELPTASYVCLLRCPCSSTPGVLRPPAE